MNSENENEQHVLTPEETQRLKQYLEYQTERLEVIGLLDKYSASFADWSIIISEAIHKELAIKQKSNVDCLAAQKMLDNITYLFTKLAYHRTMLSDWHRELAFRIENSEKMLK